MYICVCNAVTDTEIRHCANEGARTLNALREQLGVASCCGKCTPYACQILSDCRNEPAAVQADLQWT